MHDFRDSGWESKDGSGEGEEAISFDEGSINEYSHLDRLEQRVSMIEEVLQPVTEHNGPAEDQANITLTDEGEWWVAKDMETGVTSQGKTRMEALENLDEAVTGYNGEGREPTDEELLEIGISPENNVSGEPLPDEFL